MSVDQFRPNSDSTQTNEGQDKKSNPFITPLLMLSLAACNINSEPRKLPEPQPTQTPNTQPKQKESVPLEKLPKDPSVASIYQLQNVNFWENKQDNSEVNNLQIGLNDLFRSKTRPVVFTVSKIDEGYVSVTILNKNLSFAQLSQDYGIPPVMFPGNNTQNVLISKHNLKSVISMSNRELFFKVIIPCTAPGCVNNYNKTQNKVTSYYKFRNEQFGQPFDHNNKIPAFQI